MSKRNLLFVFSLFLVLNSNSQPKQLRFNRLSVENGLPGNNISQTIQDKEGFIWIGTDAGLVRYDGYQVKSYNLGISKSVGISKIYEDHSGRLWFYTKDKLFQYNHSADSFTFRKVGDNIFSIQDDLKGNIWLGSSQDIYCVNPNNRTDSILHFSTEEKGKNKINASLVNAVFADPTGGIWIGTDSGLHYYDTLSLSIKRYIFSNHDLDSKNVFAVWCTVSSPDILWMTSGEMKDSMAKGNISVMYRSKVTKGIMYMDLKNHSFKTYQTNVNELYSIGDNTVNIVYEDTKNRIWMGTLSGLSLFDKTTERFINYSDKKTATPVFEIKEDPAGNFWCKTTNGLLYFDTQTNAFTKYERDEHEPDAMPENISNIFMDKQGTLWIGTRDRGLFMANWQKSRFALYKDTPDHNFTGGQTFDFAESKDGTIWLGSANGLYQWAPATDSFKKIDLLKHKIDRLDVRNVIVDKKGVVWCSGSVNGLFTYNPVTGVIKNYRYNQNDTSSLSRDLVSCILEDRLGTIWIAGDGLCSYNRDSDNFIRYRASDHIWKLYEDRKGQLLVTTLFDSEIKVIDKINRAFLPFQNDTSISGIFTLYEDKQNNLWHAGSEGLFLSNVQNKKVQNFSEKDGLFYNQVEGISEDSKGKIWVNGLRGIFVYDPPTKLFRNISTDNGLPEIQMDGKSFISNEGQVFIGCHDGFIVFNPNDFSADDNAPVIHIETLNYKTKSAGNSEKDTLLRTYGLTNIHLRYNENRVIFNYVGLYYQNPALIQYAYKLDGYDHDWIQAGTQRSATYTNLSPGTYTFHVKAANSDGVWITQDDSINIIISPPWWKTWWAYLLYAICIIGLTIFIFRWRTASLRKDKKILEQKVTERTAEVVAEKKEVERQKHRSDELLLNILPEEVAEELKANGKADAKQFDEVTVMFTDFKGFTQISEKLTPTELVAEIDTCFKAFDHIIGKYNIEKIKTIGDSYMCAGGLPVSNITNASDVVNAAMEIQMFMQEHLEQRKKQGKEPFEIRIGIHTGPVVAGIVGIKKFAYDIWGDTVNIASRMESSGEAGKINISGATYELIKDKFSFIHRGKIHAKNKGEIDMYFVEGVL